MAHHNATPDTLEDVAARAQPGDRITLSSGLYGRTSLKNLKGPITIDAEEGAIFDGRRRRQDFDQEANAEAKRAQDAGQYPSLIKIALQGQLVLDGCSDLTLTGMAFRGCWPTCIAITRCRNITVANVVFREGTFGLYAEGAEVHGLTLDNCSFIQDISEQEMWRDIDWERIHSNHPVQATDRRALDGEFLRTFGISGGVTVRNCTIRHAFNGIHMYHSREDGNDPTLNRDVRIHDNRFEFIRDNAVEPERGAYNWWVFHNHIRNCHKVFSVECTRSGPTYFVGNTYWFDEKPTPHLDYNGGAIWKLPKEVEPTGGTNYALHNSFYLRSKYIKKRRWRDLYHANNAIEYCADFCHPDGTCDPTQSFFGRIHDPKEKRRFTKDWAALNIQFRGDIAHHHQFPQALTDAGYALQQARGVGPGFLDPRVGDFRLRSNAPARGTGVGVDVDLPDGSVWSIKPGGDVGAWQGETRIAMPQVAYGDAAPPVA